MCRPDTGKKLMGVIAAADGNMNGQLKRFQDTLDVWLTRIDDGHLPPKGRLAGLFWYNLANNRLYPPRYYNHAQAIWKAHATSVPQTSVAHRSK